MSRKLMPVIKRKFIGLTAGHRSASSDPQVIAVRRDDSAREMVQETALGRSVLQTGQIPRFVGSKVLPSSLSTCPECFLFGPSVTRSWYDRKPSLSCFAHWYSRYFQLTRPVCLPERNFAVFSNRLFLHRRLLRYHQPPFSARARASTFCCT